MSFVMVVLQVLFSCVKKARLFFWVCIPLFLQAQSLEEKEWIDKGNQYYLQKAWNKALQNYANALEINSNSVKALYNTANVYMQQKKYAEAEKQYQKALNLTQDRLIQAKIQHNLGNAYYDQSRWDSSIKAYKNSLRLEPSDEQTRHNLALALQKKKTKKKNTNPPDLPSPSDFAKQLKQQADQLNRQGEFLQAFLLMQQGAVQDSTVMHYRNFIAKLYEVVQLDTIQSK